MSDRDRLAPADPVQAGPSILLRSADQSPPHAPLRLGLWKVLQRDCARSRNCRARVLIKVWRGCIVLSTNWFQMFLAVQRAGIGGSLVLAWSTFSAGHCNPCRCRWTAAAARSAVAQPVGQRRIAGAAAAPGRRSKERAALAGGGLRRSTLLRKRYGVIALAPRWLEPPGSFTAAVARVVARPPGSAARSRE